MNDEDTRPQGFAVAIDGDFIPDSNIYTDDGRTRIEIVGDEDANTGPLAWANSASIILDPDDDAITVAISTGDPRGGFTMTIRRIPDGDHENAGALVMHVPHPDDSTLHEDLHEFRPGAYFVGGAA